MQNVTTNAIVSGCLTWWEPKPADAARLYSELESIGLGQYAPRPATAEAALQAAMKQWGDGLGKQKVTTTDAKHQYKVFARRDKKQDGFELVDVTRKRGPNSYACECACRVYPAMNQVEALEGYVDIYQLQEAFDQYRKQASGADVGRSLVQLTQAMNGTCVRMNGGNYYLPEGVVQRWYDVIDVFEQCSQTVVTRMRVVMDDIAARAIRKGIVEELIKESAKMAEELRHGDLAEDVIERRKIRSMELRAKAKMYEEILSDTLTEVHAVLDLADSCAAAALATQEDKQVFDFESTFG
ncbi:MAG: DUF6744 family protein [Candidatus Omnitrophota bacterium]